MSAPVRRSRIIEVMAQQRDTPLTVAEIAEQSGYTVAQVRTALASLQRGHEVHKAGSAFGGGQCWALGEVTA